MALQPVRRRDLKGQRELRLDAEAAVATRAQTRLEKAIEFKSLCQTPIARKDACLLCKQASFLAGAQGLELPRKQKSSYERYDYQ